MCAKGEDLQTFERVLTYVLELAKCDLNYDVRDRAYLLEKLLSFHLHSRGMDKETNHLPENKALSHFLAECLFVRQRKRISPEPYNHRIYLPGSLSQIVLHAAPGYEPLPRPCSLVADGQEINDSGELATNSGSSETDDSRSLSGSDESASHSQHTDADSSGSVSNDDAGSASEDDGNADPLIQISDVSNINEVQNGASQSDSADFRELLSNRALESWLEEQPGVSTVNTSEPSSVHRSSARISIGDIKGQVKPKSYALLDPVTGNGLKVDYSFSSEMSNVSPLLVCIDASFKNCSGEPISDITIVDEESSKDRDSADQALDTTER